MTHLPALYDAAPRLGTWAADAACAGMDTERFYPDARDAHAERAATAVCDRCDVRAECLTYALAYPSHGLPDPGGVWGGLTAKQRHQLRRAT